MKIKKRKDANYLGNSYWFTLVLAVKFQAPIVYPILKKQTMVRQAHHKFFDRLTKGFFTSLNLRQLTEGKQLLPLIPPQGGKQLPPFEGGLRRVIGIALLMPKKA